MKVELNEIIERLDLSVDFIKRISNCPGFEDEQRIFANGEVYALETFKNHLIRDYKDENDD